MYATLLILLIFSQVKALKCGATPTCDVPNLYHNTGAGTALTEIEVIAESSTAVETGLFDQFDDSGSSDMNDCGSLVDQAITTLPTGLESYVSFDLATKKLTISSNVPTGKAGFTYDVKVKYFLAQIGCNSLAATCAFSQRESGGGPNDIGTRYLPDDNSYVDGHACAAICNLDSTCTAWSYHDNGNTDGDGNPNHRHCDLSTTASYCNAGTCDPTGTGGDFKSDRWAGNKVPAVPASTPANCSGDGRPSMSQTIPVKISSICENTWTLTVPQSSTFFLNPVTTSAFPSDPNATPVDGFISNTNAG